MKLNRSEANWELLQNYVTMNLNWQWLLGKFSIRETDVAVKYITDSLSIVILCAILVKLKTSKSVSLQPSLCMLFKKEIYCDYSDKSATTSRFSRQ